MPTIRPYQQAISSQADIPGRRAGASDFSTADAQAGAGLQNLGASLYDMAERSEVSDAHARLATARAEWTVHLQERAQAAAPGDPNFASNFNQDLAKYLDKSGGYATTAGSRAYQQGSAELAAHFVQSAGVFQARSMGEKAKLDYGTIVNQSALAAYNDPTQYDSATAALKSALYDPNGTFARIGGQRDELFKSAQQELARNTMKGLINFAPELAQKQLTENTGAAADINAKDRDALDSEIKTAIRAKEIEAERLNNKAEKDERKHQEAVASSLFDGIIAGKVSAQDIVKSGLKRPEKEALFNFMKAQGGETDRDAKTYGPNFVAMLQRVNTDKPPTDTEIMNTVGKGITTAGANQLMTWAHGRKTTEGAANADITHSFLQGAKQVFAGPVVIGLPKYSQGGLVYSNWLRYALPEIERQKKAGKSLDEILDPKGALAASVQAYRPSYQDMMTDIQAQAAGAPPDPTQSGKFLGSPGVKPAAPASVTVPIGIDTSRATRTGKKGGRPVYEIDGKWVFGDGSAVQ